MIDIDILEEQLRQFSNMHGATGNETNISILLQKELENVSSDATVDSMGNTIIHKNGRKPSVLIAAHMDEIGLMVQSITAKGFIRFIKLGGWFDQVILGQRVVLHGSLGDVYGVIGSKLPHAMSEEEKKKAVPAESMFIDVGAADRDEVMALGIDVGTTATMDREFMRFGTGRNLVTGKCLDDRAGIVVMVEVMKKLKGSSLDIFAVGTSQEEVGARGAGIIANRINPDLAIVVDTTGAGGYPGAGSSSTLFIGKGPAITIADREGRGYIAPMALVERVKKVAKDHSINYQLQVAAAGSTDASMIYVSREGIPTVVLKMPTRYIHSPVEVMDLADMASTIDLVEAVVTDVEKNGI